MKKQWLAVMSTLVLGSTVLAGCGGSSDSQTTAQTSSNSSNAEITFYEAMPGAMGDELKSLTNDFMKQNPGIKVNLVFSGDYNTQKQKLTAAIAAQNPPTMAQVQETWETEYYNNKLLAPLQDLLPQATIDDMVPAFKDDNSYDGKLISAPFNKSDYVLYYNTDAFAKAGITNPPTTWDELEADAKKLNTGSMKGIGMQANYYTFEMLMKQAGGEVLNSDNTQAAFGDDSGKKALDFMHKLAVDDKVAYVAGGKEYLSDSFNTGKFAMDMDTVAAMSFLKNVHYKTAPLPGNAKKAVPATGTNLVVFAKATDAQKKAAAKYIDFLISKDNTIQWAEKTGYLPVRQSALTDPAWQDFVKQDPNKGVGAASLSDAYFSPRLAALFSGENAVSTEVGNFISNGQSEADTLKKSVDAINNALAGK